MMEYADYGEDSSLNYDASASAFVDGGPVDWRQVDAELARIPDEFKDPRFDSLRQAANMKVLKLGQLDTGDRLKEVKMLHLCAYSMCRRACMHALVQHQVSVGKMQMMLHLCACNMRTMHVCVRVCVLLCVASN